MFFITTEAAAISIKVQIISQLRPKYFSVALVSSFFVKINMSMRIIKG